MKPDTFSTDLTEEQWAAIEPLIPPPAAGGRKRAVNMREVVNGIHYLLATNCGWRGLPDTFPNRSTVRHYYDAWRDRGVWEQIEKVVAVARVAPNSLDCANGEDTPKLDDSTC